MDLKSFTLSQYAINSIAKLQAADPNNAPLVIEFIREQHTLGWNPNYKIKCALWACRLSELTGYKSFRDLEEEDIQKIAMLYRH
ncbi:MAG: hypothetical protein WBZ36_10565 [Candidatus Nitrosopolaris sp.]